MNTAECINILVRSQDKLVEIPFSVKLSEHLDFEVTEIMEEYKVKRSVVIRTLIHLGLTQYKSMQF